ncbi:MAG: DEAD/DEAH box helicase family protein [Candidatus Gastranaerophilales bacterium]|nr:DEAD/DEAH box helicase family protein [Candidatus Gastranaerophilales bacterium]
MEKILEFKGQWRDYQERILNNLSLHLSDKKLHVVAAPGAGKTTLGIEIIARISNPVLILVPTITIKNQWKGRIVDAFLNGDEKELISTNIREPKFITISTYQALLASFCGKEDEEEEEVEEADTESSRDVCGRLSETKAQKVIASMKAANIKLCCFDEAHHLRKEWWKALDYLVGYLEPEQTISLTATPPYDVDYEEWSRYEELCGPIDEIISIPELVKNGDLCPHQDFLHISKIRDFENTQINQQLENISKFMEALLSNDDLAHSLRISSFLKEPDFNIDLILSDPEFYVSIVSFLKEKNKTIPIAFLKIFDAKESELPKFDNKQAKLLLSGLLIKHREEFAEIEKQLDALAKQARECKILQNKTIYMDDNPKIKRQLASSSGKIDSILEIVDLESRALQEKLRMVILADYIKYKEEESSQLGVIPIWSALKDNFKGRISLGVLSGKIILLPKNTENDFYKILEKNNIPKENVTIKAFERDGEYLQITPKKSIKSQIVHLITDLFNKGHITVLVGTQALLGEGWDAPSINTLILSSTVSSYMLSNQMRGRAIRIDKNNPDKVANIWHLASVRTPNIRELLGTLFSSCTKDILEGWSLYDIAQLQKRFSGFEAPSFYKPYVIQSDIERLFLTKKKMDDEDTFVAINLSMKIRAKDRALTKAIWNECLQTPYNAPAQTLRVGVDAKMKRLDNLSYSGGYLNALVLAGIVSGILYSYVANYPKLIFAIPVIFVAMIFKPTITVLRTGSPERLLKQIGFVILETLSYQNLIKTNLKLVKIKCDTDSTKRQYFYASGLPVEENNLLIQAIIEFLDPIESPRYILERTNRLFGFFKQTDFQAIPELIGEKRENINVFEGLWKKYIGDCKIFYTRTTKGRQALLHARKASFSSLTRSKKINRWQ